MPGGGGEVQGLPGVCVWGEVQGLPGGGGEVKGCLVEGERYKGCLVCVWGGGTRVAWWRGRGKGLPGGGGEVQGLPGVCVGRYKGCLVEGER